MSDEHKTLLDYDISSAMMNADNPYQGTHKRVLCVCSAGILRSATAALVLSQDPFHFNTRSAGVMPYALIPVTLPLLVWAQQVVCMTNDHELMLRGALGELETQMGVGYAVPIVCLGIPDSFAYRDEDLMIMIREKYKALSK